jgi:fluoride exporter
MRFTWPYLWVFLGAGFGGALRHGANRAGFLLTGAGFPVGTVFVNIAGSLAMGLLTGWFAFRGESSTQALRLFLTTGVLGGFTTFSAFSLDAALMWERHQMSTAAAYVLGSVFIAIAAVFAGLAISRALFH